MEKKVLLDLHELHIGQQSVLDQSKRFNVLCCGRRWGKTTMSEDLALCPDSDSNGCLNGFPVGYFAPTYKMLMEVWRDTISTLYPLIKTKSETEKRIELYGGGTLDFWSLEEPNVIRGRFYKRVIVDEAASAPKLKEAWLHVIRPTLTDLKGDAWFLSTPKGKNNYFYDIFLNQDKLSDWRSWQMPTASNPHIPAEEVEAAKRELDPLTFAQEYLASFVTQELDSFAYCYNPEKHLGKTELNRKYEVVLSFDFNRNPITCGVFQDYNDWSYGIEQIKLNNSNIYSLCDYISVGYKGCLFLITGDATGKASSALVQDNINYYTVIKSKLNLSASQIKVPAINPSLVENKVLVNSFLHNHNFVMDKDKCRGLAFDLEYARVLPDGGLDKTDRNDPTKQLDALDCFRYYLNTFHRHTVKL